MTEPAHDTWLLPREPGSIRLGDRVRINRQKRKFHGRVGVVAKIDPDRATGGCGDLLHIRVGKTTIPLFADELEVLGL